MKDILEKGEKVIWEGKPNKKSYLISRLLPMVIILLLFGTFFLFIAFMFFETSSNTADIMRLNLTANDLTKNPKKVANKFSKIYTNYKKYHENELKELEVAKTKEDHEHNEKLKALDEEHQLNINKIQSKYFKNVFNQSDDYNHTVYQNDLNFENTRYEDKVKFENDWYNNKTAFLKDKYGMISDIISYVNEEGEVDISSLTNESFSNMLQNYNSASNILNMVRFFPFLVMILILLSIIGSIVATIIQSKNLYYAATDRRLIIQHGVIGLDYRSFEYTKIDDLYVKVGVIDKIFNTGSISLVTEYIVNNNRTKAFHRLIGEANSFLAIDKPYEVFKKIQTISKDLRTDVYYPNDLRPATNKGYKTKYKK